VVQPNAPRHQLAELPGLGEARNSAVGTRDPALRRSPPPAYRGSRGELMQWGPLTHAPSSAALLPWFAVPCFVLLPRHRSKQSPPPLCHITSASIAPGGRPALRFVALLFSVKTSRGRLLRAPPNQPPKVNSCGRNGDHVRHLRQDPVVRHSQSPATAAPPSVKLTRVLSAGRSHRSSSPSSRVTRP
jgi:hypothetical protein